jgi:hypothetical protein
VTLTAISAVVSPGVTVRFLARAQESHATGALSYQLLYGDGTSDQAATPALCRPGAGVPAQETWRLTHHYRAAGSYSAAVTVQAQCTTDRAMATVPVVVK